VTSAKDNTTADAAAETTSGFAALEAKVREIQAEAATEGEAATAGAAASSLHEELSWASAAKAPPERPWAADSSAATGIPAALSAPVQDLVSAYAECAQSLLRFQAETFADFAQVRGPGDLLAANMAYGERALQLYVGGLARLAQAIPALAGAEVRH